MNDNVLIIITLLLTAIAAVAITRIAIKRNVGFWNSLPSLEEARLIVAKEFPDHSESFVLTQKVTDTMHGDWGAFVCFYGDFLVCEELGVSIHVRLEEKMS